ncbi:2-nonaprenyl-3-methyl-6-methoxy-1,4-benzoquinol hydroxylase [Rickettsiales bacterium]|nr:2-nonaprenyl-3-methyl-6-methoxy-1,4-benzoquinol hydroxylase [Rickettsiales bacterium]
MKKNLPGDLSQEKIIERAIRVNHAGEYGAKYIYKGQIAILKNSSLNGELQHMLEQECRHLEFFNKQINKYKVRPSFLLPLWRVAGYALGAGTALMGKRYAMTCTAAVEDVIDDHYNAQLGFLPESALKEGIAKIREEEIEHQNTATDYIGKRKFMDRLLESAIKRGCKLAILVAQKL